MLYGSLLEALKSEIQDTIRGGGSKLGHISTYFTYIALRFESSLGHDLAF